MHRRCLELELLFALEFAKLALELTKFSFDGWPGTRLAFERRTRRRQRDAAEGLRAPAAIGHGREAVEECLVLGLLLVLQLEFVGEFLRELELLLQFAGEFEFAFALGGRTRIPVPVRWLQT